MITVLTQQGQCKLSVLTKHSAVETYRRIALQRYAFLTLARNEVSDQHHSQGKCYTVTKA